MSTNYSIDQMKEAFKNKDTRMTMLDRNKDGQLDATEISIWDADHDGTISDADIQNSFTNIDDNYAGFLNFGMSDGIVSEDNIQARYEQAVKDAQAAQSSGGFDLVKIMQGDTAQDTARTLVAVGEACNEPGATCSPALAPSDACDNGASPIGQDGSYDGAICTIKETPNILQSIYNFFTGK